MTIVLIVTFVVTAALVYALATCAPVPSQAEIEDEAAVTRPNIRRADVFDTVDDERA